MRWVLYRESGSVANRAPHESILIALGAPHNYIGFVDDLAAATAIRAWNEPDAPTPIAIFTRQLGREAVDESGQSAIFMQLCDLLHASNVSAFDEHLGHRYRFPHHQVLQLLPELSVYGDVPLVHRHIQALQYEPCIVAVFKCLSDPSQARRVEHHPLLARRGALPVEPFPRIWPYFFLLCRRWRSFHCGARAS